MYCAYCPYYAKETLERFIKSCKPVSGWAWWMDTEVRVAILNDTC